MINQILGESFLNTISVSLCECHVCMSIITITDYKISGFARRMHLVGARILHLNFLGHEMLSS